MTASVTFDALAANASDHDVERRQLLLLTAAAAGIGAATVAVPLVSSFAPSERAKAAGAAVEADISDLAPGAVKTIEWRGTPVWVMRRTPEMLAGLAAQDSLLVDPASEVKSQQPAYAQNAHRSINPEFFVAVGICTHLGCSPNSVAAGSANPSVGSDWKGGFFCPCHGSTFDLAGRVYKNQPSPDNLEVPPHMYLSDAKLLIGEDKKA